MPTVKIVLLSAARRKGPLHLVEDAEVLSLGDTQPRCRYDPDASTWGFKFLK